MGLESLYEIAGQLLRVTCETTRSHEAPTVLPSWTSMFVEATTRFLVVDSTLYWWYALHNSDLVGSKHGWNLEGAQSEVKERKRFELLSLVKLKKAGITSRLQQQKKRFDSDSWQYTDIQIIEIIWSRTKSFDYPHLSLAGEAFIKWV